LAVAAEQGYRLQDEALRLSKIPKLRFAEIGEVGHMIHWHRPEALVRELLEFFAHSAA
jgi:pimeloyl-ACP methyl ester carboxylesterase